ncbi:uncharacterized protein LOC109710396 isoform X1 [Ananas comosus]|uniref:Uncharacterized protein LOC109710396 isoform X1 n=1 Tax=Ananas comosus TaxID=4615 RepID=A0A6P5F5H7_ANACO|nr:uncharacterized protein LOC109710396 isoform X1 [Ananas comosus]
MAMASISASDGALLLLLLGVLLPLRLLSLGRRLLRGGHRRFSGAIRSVAVVVSAAALLSAIYAVSDRGDAPARTDAAAPASASEVAEMRSEIADLKRQISRLESILAESTTLLHSKTVHVEEDSILIEAMERDIQSLINEQQNTKKLLGDSSFSQDSVKAMEEEVRLLKDQSRAISSNIYILESLANDAEKRLEAMSSEVRKMENVISEQWIQVQQFEQAFQLTKMMTSKVHKRSMPKEGTDNKWLSKYSITKVIQFVTDNPLRYIPDVGLLDSLFLAGSLSKSWTFQAYDQFQSILSILHKCHHEVRQFAKGLHLRYIPDVDLPDSLFLGGSLSKSLISQANNQFRRIMLVAQKCHQKVQELVRNTVGLNQYTAALANESTYFFLAYIIMALQLWLLWMLLAN